ncbi:MAG: hypothetical protein FWE20_12240 [Defluviitaleaceae bacterium]|nr:hypothetical protein [Defluviitaleaceae bacterium]
MTKIKPAFRSTTELANVQEDFARAVEYGPMWVGEDALYIFDFYDTRYIPLQELVSIEMDVQDSAMCGCGCNLTAATPHDVKIVDKFGETFHTRAIDPNKIHYAAEKIKTLNPSMHFRTTGANYSAAKRTDN